MFAENYDLGRSDRAKATDILVKLVENTPLLNIIKHSTSVTSTCTTSPLPSNVDRVVLLLEQMIVKNSHWKQFSIELGKLLQRQVPDPNACVVKLSEPHLHRATGPMFRIGDKIVKELQRVPATYGRKPVANAQHSSTPSTSSICEPFDTDDEQSVSTPRDRWAR